MRAIKMATHGKAWKDLINVQSKVRIPSPLLRSFTSLMTRKRRKKLMEIMFPPGCKKNTEKQKLIIVVYTKTFLFISHSLIRGVLIQSCSAGAKNFTNYVFCHPQFSGVILNIENRCAILTPICLCQLLSN